MACMLFIWYISGLPLPQTGIGVCSCKLTKCIQVDIEQLARCQLVGSLNRKLKTGLFQAVVC